MTMYGAFHPKSDVERLYLKTSEGGRVNTSDRRIRSLNKNGWREKDVWTVH